MSSPAEATLSLGEKLHFAGALLKTLVYTGLAALTGFLRPHGEISYRDHIVFTGIRTLTSSTSVRQMQSLAASTRETYSQCMESAGLPVKVVDLAEESTQVCWLGEKDSKTVMLFFHGGGYVGAASLAHLQLLRDTWKEAEKMKGAKSLSILLLCYDLAPYGQYPRQLRQAVAAFRYLLDMKFSPSQIIIAGDSAGGNLALALVSHLCTPHPDLTPIPLSDSSKLLGVVLLSPWVGFPPNPTPSRIANAGKDCISQEALSTWSAAFMGQAPSDYYAEAVNAPVEWWTPAMNKVERFLITGGGNEIFIDDIKTLGERMQKAAVEPSQVTLLIVPREIHDEPLMDYLVGRKEKSESGRAWSEWVLGRI